MRIVIKLGGKALAAEGALEDLARELLRLAGHQVCLVHGGGDEVNALLERLGIAPKFVNGLRATDGATLEVVEMVLSGKVNPSLVAHLNQRGLKAVGLCGKDGGLLRAKQADPSSGLGFVGEPEEINTGVLLALWEKGFLPVLSSIGTNPEGQSLNLNADTMACALAKSLRADLLLLFTDSEGVYRGGNGKKDLIPEIHAGEAETLIAQGVVCGGMIPKVREARAAKAGGVGRVWITRWDSAGLESLVREGGFHGTEIL
jgi:acetylglutamate kinase